MSFIEEYKRLELEGKKIYEKAIKAAPKKKDAVSPKRINELQYIDYYESVNYQGYEKLQLTLNLNNKNHEKSLKNRFVDWHPELEPFTPPMTNPSQEDVMKFLYAGYEKAIDQRKRLMNGEYNLSKNQKYISVETKEYDLMHIKQSYLEDINLFVDLGFDINKFVNIEEYVELSRIKNVSQLKKFIKNYQMKYIQYNEGTKGSEYLRLGYKFSKSKDCKTYINPYTLHEVEATSHDTKLDAVGFRVEISHLESMWNEFLDVTGASESIKPMFTKRTMKEPDEKGVNSGNGYGFILGQFIDERFFRLPKMGDVKGIEKVIKQSDKKYYLNQLKTFHTMLAAYLVWIKRNYPKKFKSKSMTIKNKVPGFVFNAKMYENIENALAGASTRSLTLKSAYFKNKFKDRTPFKISGSMDKRRGGTKAFKEGKISKDEKYIIKKMCGLPLKPYIPKMIYPKPPKKVKEIKKYAIMKYDNFYVYFEVINGIEYIKFRDYDNMEFYMKPYYPKFDNSLPFNILYGGVRNPLKDKPKNWGERKSYYRKLTPKEELELFKSNHS